MHPVDFLPSVPLLITQLPPTDTTNWSGAHMEWMTAVTRLESSSQEARTATSSFMTLLRSWLEGVMWSLLRVTGTRDQWELWTSTPFKYDPFSSCFMLFMNPLCRKYSIFWFSFLLQTNLVASGGNESEIYIWDLNNFGSPMTPGPKTQVFYWLWICWKLHWIIYFFNYNIVCMLFLMLLLFDFLLKACGGHQLCVLEQTSPAHLGLSQPQWASISVGPP